MNNPILMVDPTGMAADTIVQGGDLAMVTVLRSVISRNSAILVGVAEVAAPAIAGWMAGDLISKNIGSITSGIASGLVYLGFDPKKLYAPDILNNYTLNSETKTVEDLKKGSTFERKKNQKDNEVYGRKGGFKQAKKDFESLGP